MRNPAVFLETAGLSALPTPTGLFLPSQQPLSESPKLPALRADVSAKVCARHLGFLLLRRLRLVPPPKAARRLASSAFAVSATPPHVGATSGFVASGGYSLGCVRKAAQTADTGATARNTLSVTAASPAQAHPAPAKSPGRAGSAAYVPAAYSRLPSFHAAPLSLPHSGDRQEIDPRCHCRRA